MMRLRMLASPMERRTHGPDPARRTRDRPGERPRRNLRRRLRRWPRGRASRRGSPRRARWSTMSPAPSSRPGMIDLHTHVYWGGTSIGVEAEPIARRSGTTTFIDAGTAGPGEFPRLPAARHRAVAGAHPRLSQRLVRRHLRVQPHRDGRRIVRPAPARPQRMRARRARESRPDRRHQGARRPRRRRRRAASRRSTWRSKSPRSSACR